MMIRFGTFDPVDLVVCFYIPVMFIFLYLTSGCLLSYTNSSHTSSWGPRKRWGRPGVLSRWSCPRQRSIDGFYVKYLAMAHFTDYMELDRKRIKGFHSKELDSWQPRTHMAMKYMLQLEQDGQNHVSQVHS